MLRNKFHFLIIVSLLLITGFSSTSIIGFLVAKNALQSELFTETLPLSSDNIYSEIQRDILPSIMISSVMSQDTFVRDWIINGEKDTSKITRYLAAIQGRYNAETAFLISDASLNYYHTTGLIRKVSADNDGWYFRVESLHDDFETNLDVDFAGTEHTFFVNHKIKDYEGRYLGAIGLGISTDRLSQIIERYQFEYQRRVFFVDNNGLVVLHGEQYEGPTSLFDSPTYKAIATDLVKPEKGSFQYQHNGQAVFVTSRFIKELNWHLVIEQTDTSGDILNSSLRLNTFIGFGISVIILLLVFFMFSGYQRRLETMAMQDKLSGLNNRHAFEALAEQQINTARRRKEALSAVILDIDHFKNINDKHGHLFGDEVITRLSAIIKSQVRKSDIICRWGGEEFLILLPASDAKTTQVLAEKLRLSIERECFESPHGAVTLTASFGLSVYEPDEDLDALLGRADKALYQAKDQGRNCIVLETKTTLKG